MKQLLITLLCTVCLLATSASAHAQSAQLQISRLFDGRVVPVQRMILTRVRGKALSKYQLSYYRSARFKASEAEAEQVAAMVKADKVLCDQHHLTSQSVKSNSGSSRTESQIFSLPPENHNNRFISMVTKRERSGQYLITVIYMEGKVKDVYELSRLIDQ